MKKISKELVKKINSVANKYITNKDQLNIFINTIKKYKPKSWVYSGPFTRQGFDKDILIKICDKLVETNILETYLVARCNVCYHELINIEKNKFKEQLKECYSCGNEQNITYNNTFEVYRFI